MMNLASDSLFIGLGAMGAELAKRLAACQGKTTFLHDINIEAVQKLIEDIPHSKAFDAVTHSEPFPRMIFTCLPNSGDVQQVLNTLWGRIEPETLWFDCTSGDPILDKEFTALLRKKASLFIDVGISGGPRGAREGALTAMVGCPEDVFHTVSLVFQRAAKLTVWCGEAGAGHAVKAINNILMGTNLLAASEGLSVLSKYGVGTTQALLAINQSSGRSWATQDRLPKYVLPGTYNYGFQLSLLRKDMLTALKLASGLGSTTPILSSSFAIIEKVSRILSPHVDHTQIAQVIARLQSTELLPDAVTPYHKSPSLHQLGIKLVVFDCAGTTIDEGGLVYHTLQQVMQNTGCIAFTPEEFDKWHGANKIETLQFFGSRAGMSEEAIQAMYADFLNRLQREYFSLENVGKVTLVPGTLELFKALREAGIKVCLNTGYPRSIADRLLLLLDLNDKIDGLVVAEDVGMGRPYPYMIHHLARKHTILDMRQVAKVGDTVRDIEEGRFAGCGLVVGVLSGSDTADEQLKAGADLILSSVAALCV